MSWRAAPRTGRVLALVLAAGPAGLAPAELAESPETRAATGILLARGLLTVGADGRVRAARAR